MMGWCGFQRNRSRGATRRDPERGPQAEEQQQTCVVADVVEVEAARHVGDDQEHGDDDQVVEHGRRHREHEPPAGVEDRGDQGGHAVEQNLGGEHAEQRCGDGLLVAPFGAMEPEAVQVDDGGGDDDEQQRHPDQDQEGGGDDDGDGLPRVVLVARGQVLDEHRDDEGRHDPAEHEVVDDVRGGVGQVVAVGEAREAEGVGEGDDAAEPGEARQEGGDRHAGRGAREPACGSVADRRLGDVGVAARHQAGTSRRARRP